MIPRKEHIDVRKKERHNEINKRHKYEVFYKIEENSCIFKLRYKLG
jgi:hypothetical protein